MERLIEWDLMALKDCRGYIDQVETYKIVYGITCKDPTTYFTFTGTFSPKEWHQSGTIYQQTLRSHVPLESLKRALKNILCPPTQDMMATIIIDET